MPKAPSLSDILADPGKLHNLSTVQLHDLAQSLKKIGKQLHGSADEAGDSPAALAMRLSNGRWEMAPHLDVMSKALADLEKGKRQRLLVSMPPRHGKSQLISHWFPLWLLARNPSRRIILASYEADFAAHWGRKVRNLVVEHGEELGLQLEGSSMAAYRWDLTAGGGMLSVGAGGQITGRGADALIIDDPIKNDEDASSETMREKLWDWFWSTAFTRLEPGGFVVMVATRWHQDDLLGRLERFGLSGESLPWDVIRLPALAEEGDALGREEGAPLWPERYNKEALAQIRRGMSPYHFSALYQQRPTPEEGGAIKRRWWKYYQVPPTEFDQVIMSWDLAFKDLKKSDYTAGQVWGRKGAEFYLLHQVRDRMNAPEVLIAARNMAKQYPKAVAKLIEDRANGPAVIAMLHKELTGIIPIKVKASKDARLQAVVPLIEAGNVYLPHPEVAPWVTDFVEECAAFPHGTNDDQLDAAVHALTYMMPGGWQAIAKAHREAKEGPPPQTVEEIQKHQLRKQVKKHIQRFERDLIRKNLPQSMGTRRRIKSW